MKLNVKATSTKIEKPVVTKKAPKKRVTKQAVRSNKKKMDRIEFKPEMIRKVVDERTPRQKHEAMLRDHAERKIARKENHRRNRFARSVIPITLV